MWHIETCYSCNFIWNEFQITINSWKVRFKWCLFVFFRPVCVGRLNTLQLRHTNPGGVCRWNISTISTHCCSANLSGLHACFQVATHGGGGFIRSRRGTSLASAWQQMPFVISVPGRRAATQQTSKNCQGDKYIDTGGSGMWGRPGERPHFLFAFIQRSD